MDIEFFVANFQEKFNRYISKNFIVDPTTKTYKFCIKNSIIRYQNGLFEISHKSEIIATDILCYEIALLIAEFPKSKNEFVLVDNEYSKHYNDIVFYLNAFRNNKEIIKDAMTARYDISKARIDQILKRVRSKSKTLKIKDK